MCLLGDSSQNEPAQQLCVFMLNLKDWLHPPTQQHVRGDSEVFGLEGMNSFFFLKDNVNVFSVV